jgi:hypothetical protein
VAAPTSVTLSRSRPAHAASPHCLRPTAPPSAEADRERGCGRGLRPTRRTAAGGEPGGVAARRSGPLCLPAPFSEDWGTKASACHALSPRWCSGGTRMGSRSAVCVEGVAGSCCGGDRSVRIGSGADDDIMGLSPPDAQADHPPPADHHPRPPGRNAAPPTPSRVIPSLNTVRSESPARASARTSLRDNLRTLRGNAVRDNTCRVEPRSRTTGA